MQITARAVAGGMGRDGRDRSRSRISRMESLSTILTANVSSLLPALFASRTLLNAPAPITLPSSYWPTTCARARVNVCARACVHAPRVQRPSPPICVRGVPAFSAAPRASADPGRCRASLGGRARPARSGAGSRAGARRSGQGQDLLFVERRGVAPGAAVVGRRLLAPEHHPTAQGRSTVMGDVSARLATNCVMVRKKKGSVVREKERFRCS